MNVTTRLKVLIIAHELSPKNGSECGEGWNIVTRLAKFHDITVLYANGSQHGNNDSYKDSINNYLLSVGPIIGLTFINIEQPRKTKITALVNRFFANKMGPTGIPMLYYLGYKFWQKAAFEKAKELHKIKRFDVTHQLTQITFREPGYLWKLNIPFFWGPTGGTSPLPKGFYKALSRKAKILENIRSLSAIYDFKFSSRLIKANKKASIIYSYSDYDAVKFRKRAKGMVKIMLDAGASIPTEEYQINKIQNTPPLRGIWCGRLYSYKAPSILLKALALSRYTMEKVQFQIIGSGTLEKSLIKLSEDLNLKNIEWIKQVSHDEVFRLMRNADFFVHTSRREATTNVIPEALSMGLPVICHDTSGMSIAVNESCGIKIPFISPERSIKGFHNAIERLILNRSLLEELKNGALNRSVEISWDRMAETIANDYLDIVNK